MPMLELANTRDLIFVVPMIFALVAPTFVVQKLFENHAFP